MPKKPKDLEDTIRRALANTGSLFNPQSPAPLADMREAILECKSRFKKEFALLDNYQKIIDSFLDQDLASVGATALRMNKDEVPGIDRVLLDGSLALVGMVGLMASSNLLRANTREFQVRIEELQGFGALMEVDLHNNLFNCFKAIVDNL